MRACLAQHFFAHSPDKGLPVLPASHTGRRPHDSPVPISRVTPQLQQPEKLQSLALFVYFCLSALSPINYINPSVSECECCNAARERLKCFICIVCSYISLYVAGSSPTEVAFVSLSDCEIYSFIRFLYILVLPSFSFFVQFFHISPSVLCCYYDLRLSEDKNELTIIFWFMNPQNDLMRCFRE